MEIKSSGVSKPLQILVDPRYRPFCFQSFPSSCSLCLLETLGNWIHTAKTGMIFKCVGLTKKRYVFPPFSLIDRILGKVLIDQPTLILITPAWQTQSWYPQLLRLLFQNPFILPIVPDLLQGPNK